MEVLSVRVRELYQMLSIKTPVITKDMRDIRLDVDVKHTDQQLIDFLNGKMIINQPLEDKPPAMDGSCLQILYQLEFPHL